MGTAKENTVNFLQRADYLVKIQKDQDVEPVLSGMAPLQLHDLRNFLIMEIQHVAQVAGEKIPAPEEIKSNFETATNYYYKQDCKEPLESCFNESCHEANPSCFSKKMRSHIKVLNKMLLPKLGKSDAE